VLKIAAERGVAVPGALSVIGFDGSIVAEMLTPALTTVARPFGDMAEMATRHLIDLIEGQTLSDLPLLPLPLIEARSSAVWIDADEPAPSGHPKVNGSSAR
jgi:LacI family transcriptional regulator